MKLRNFVLIFFSTLFAGCDNGFYDYYSESDLWRLPLIEPYELKNTMGARKDQWNNDNWHLVFKSTKNGTTYFNGVNVTMVNVDKGIIYGYGTANPCQHFIINTSSGEEKTYEEIGEWEKQLKKLNVDSKKVYDVFDLFEMFKNEKKLLWRQ